ARGSNLSTLPVSVAGDLSAQYDQYSPTEVLLRPGVSHGARTKVDHTSLHMAASAGTGIVEVLLQVQPPSTWLLQVQPPSTWLLQQGQASYRGPAPGTASLYMAAPAGTGIVEVLLQVQPPSTWLLQQGQAS
uniref:Uncharacterized protein n=1 Tax=Oncorhynchus mykiss TaxID=8022 RepID=A0A8K9USX3_ONCMY